MQTKTRLPYTTVSIDDGDEVDFDKDRDDGDVGRERDGQAPRSTANPFGKNRTLIYVVLAICLLGISGAVYFAWFLPLDLDLDGELPEIHGDIKVDLTLT